MQAWGFGLCAQHWEIFAQTLALYYKGADQWQCFIFRTVCHFSSHDCLLFFGLCEASLLLHISSHSCIHTILEVAVLKVGGSFPTNRSLYFHLALGDSDLEHLSAPQHFSPLIIPSLAPVLEMRKYVKHRHPREGTV